MLQDHLGRSLGGILPTNALHKVVVGVYQDSISIPC